MTVNVKCPDCGWEMNDVDDEDAEAVLGVHQAVRAMDELDAHGDDAPPELESMGCRCRFTGSLADQVFTCTSCGAFPEECSDGECGCLVA